MIVLKTMQTMPETIDFKGYTIAASKKVRKSESRRRAFWKHVLPIVILDGCTSLHPLFTMFPGIDSRNDKSAIARKYFCRSICGWNALSSCVIIARDNV